MHKIRICQIVSDLKPSGPARRVCEIAARLDRKRFEVSVIALKNGALVELLNQTSTPVKILGAKGPFGLFTLARLIGLVRNFQAD
ncbi:MAG: hypothetical protein HN350_08655, partial [Phycisphaerales bacterium]|nr:hypothetical protein [Phycisphaerales bacterium]